MPAVDFSRNAQNVNSLELKHYFLINVVSLSLEHTFYCNIFSRYHKLARNVSKMTHSLLLSGNNLQPFAKKEKSGLSQLKIQVQAVIQGLIAEKVLKSDVN